MTNEEALVIIRQACASIQANLDTHQRVQAALHHIEKQLLAENEQPKPKK